MFRREKPQKGRYRQFHQIGVEVFGLEGPDIDLELILLTARLWRELGLDGMELQLNSLGTAEERGRYRELLVAYLGEHLEELDADSRRRLDTNPLRILDTKNPDMAAVVEGAPSLMEQLGAESRAHFDALCRGLDGCGLAYRINPRLVRGLDYYSLTVFEWVTDRLGAQGTVCAGGRYDGLVPQLGGRPTPAVGFAIGLERLSALLTEAGLAAAPTAPDLYLIAVGPDLYQQGLALAERLRDALPALRLHSHCGGGSFKSQFKKADRSGARFALVLGSNELARGVAGIKPLRDEGEQQEVALAELPAFLSRTLGYPA
jgi:histidyl-tRNA synthetase